MLRSELSDRLNAKIDEHSLGAARELIFAKSIECIAVSSIGADDYSETGNSRFGGDPDLPEGFEWPKALDYQRKEKSLNFICQINFADLPKLEGRETLPESGLLSLFLQFMESAAEPVEVVAFMLDADAGLVRRPSPSEDDLIDEYMVELTPNRVAFTPTIDCDAFDRKFRKELIEVCRADDTKNGREPSDDWLDNLMSMTLELPGPGFAYMYGFANTYDIEDELLRQVALSQLGLRQHQFSDYWESMEDYEATIERYRDNESMLKMYQGMRVGVEELLEKATDIESMTSRWRHFLTITSNREMQLNINDADPMYVFVEKQRLDVGDFGKLACEVTQG